MNKKFPWLIGIDEAGRGPLAGPVAVGVVVIPREFAWETIPGVGDSKQVKEENREAIFLLAKRLKKQGLLNYSVSLISHTVIDKKGISEAVRIGIRKGLTKLAINPEEVMLMLDGSLKAPVEYKYQETIIKGDSKEKVIGLASILAKVTRDKYMMKIAKRSEFAKYNLEIHKGYGTRKHCEAIVKHGLSKTHRRSFCKRFI
jgi:ribonuclease HII